MGEGTPAGPDLTRIGATRDAAWLKRFMKDPKAVMPSAEMPPYDLPDEQLDALARYLASLK